MIDLEASYQLVKHPSTGAKHYVPVYAGIPMLDCQPFRKASQAVANAQRYGPDFLRQRGERLLAEAGQKES